MQTSLKHWRAKVLASDRLIDNRELMISTAAFIAAASGIGIFLAGTAAPVLAPNPAWAWKVVGGIICVTAIWSNLTWMRRLDDIRVYRYSVFWLMVLISFDGALMIANSVAIGAMFLSLIAPTVFAAQFLKRRELVCTMAVLSLVTLAPVIIHYDKVQDVHLLSRVAAFLPIMFAVAFAVSARRRVTTHELVESETAAGIDPLTRVANLRAFTVRAEEVLSARNARISGNTGILLIDLDDFKSANTFYGHAGGDHVLRSVAAGLQRAASSTHLVARIGGDEFAVLIERASERDIGDIAIRYRNAVLSVRKRLALKGVELDASIGTAITPTDGAALEDLMTAADREMYAAKSRHAEESNVRSREEPDLLWSSEAPAPPISSAWLSTADDDQHTSAGFSLRWSRRPAHARFAGLTWALGISVGLLSLLMPDSDHSQLSTAVVVLLAGYVVAAGAYCLSFEIGSTRHIAADAFTLLYIALISYLTGGSSSPVWPTVFLFIIYAGWFLNGRQFWFRLLGPIIVVLLPLAYEGLGGITAPVGAAIYGGILVATGLTLAISYNQFYIAKERSTSQRLSTIDARTGLANRREFEVRLRHELGKLSFDAKDALALVMIDLDNFKNVNTMHGHKAGDELLKQIAGVLANCSRAEDCVARIGGDEFAVIIPQVDAKAAQHLAHRYVGAIARSTAATELTACRAVTASAGFALYGVNGRTLDELVDAADIALMSVKKSGKGAELASSAVFAEASDADPR